MFGVENADLRAPVEELGGASRANPADPPTRIYVRPVLALLEKVQVKGISHITGGGFFETSRAASRGPRREDREVRRQDPPPIFSLLAKAGNIPERDMYNTFNMGCGMSIVVAPEDADAALAVLREAGEDAYMIGEVAASEERVRLW